MRSIIIAIFSIFFISKSFGQQNPDAILGKWITEKKNCIVEVYKSGKEYKAKVVWFDVKDKKPMEQWEDEKNPDPRLRHQKLLGMEVVNNLKYDPSNSEWVDGVIYDATTGKKWDSVAWLTKSNQLKVKGYWVFKFLSQTKTFVRI